MNMKSPWLLFFGLAIGVFMNGIDMLAIGIAIEPMRKALSIDIATLQWFLTAFAIGNACFLATSGRLADFYGRKKIFILGLIVFILSSLTIALSSSPLTIIIARLIQGASGGIFPTVGIAILVSLYEPKERTKWISGMIGAGGLGLALGPVIGGFLIHYFSWRMVFLVNIPIGLIALLLTSFYVPKLALQRKVNEKIDWLGVFLLTLTLLFFTIGISQGHYWGWLSAKTLSIFGATIIALGLLIFWELKAPQPLIEFYLFKVKNFLAANLSGFILYFGVIAWILVTGIYLQRVLGMTAQGAGLSMLSFGLVIAIVSTQMGKISKRFGPKRVMVVGYLLGAVAFLGLAMMNEHPPYLLLTSLFGLFGLCFILTNACAIPAALEYMPVEKSGIATGKTMMIRWLGGSVGGAVISAVFISRSSLAMQKLSGEKNEFQSFQSQLHDMITGQKSESLLSTLFQGDHLNKAHELINTSYHHGFMISMLVLSGLFFVAFLISQFGIIEKQK